jgi:hypothetical protein
MPARSSHIPHATERTALQKMSAIRGLSPDKLHPAGKQTIARMVAKGWIERQPDGRTYCITPAGDNALRTPIPSRRYSPTPSKSEE